MPQFESHTFVPQLIWLAITFGFLYIMLAQVIVPRIASAIEARKGTISGDLQAAESLRKEAETALKSYERVLAEARAKAADIANETRQKLKADADRQRAELDAELSAKLEAAESRIASARAAALAGIKSVAADVAAAVVEKTLRARPPADIIEGAVETEMKRSA